MRGVFNVPTRTVLLAARSRCGATLFPSHVLSESDYVPLVGFMYFFPQSLTTMQQKMEQQQFTVKLPADHLNFTDV
jgi:hypothetical protein